MTVEKINDDYEQKRDLDINIKTDFMSFSREGMMVVVVVEVK